jgi:hypothetical protein
MTMDVDSLQDREALRATCAATIRRMELELDYVYRVMSDLGASNGVLNYIGYVQDKLDKLCTNVEGADVSLGLED